MPPRRCRPAAAALAALAALSAPDTPSAAEHSLEATGATTQLGLWSAAVPPALHVESGDVVRMRTVSARFPGAAHEAQGFELPRELRDVFGHHCAGYGGGAEPGPWPCGAAGPHTLTGPVHVAGAAPGDTLAVEVLSAEVWQPWSWNSIARGKGGLAAGLDAEGLAAAETEDAEVAGLRLPDAPEVQTWRNDIPGRATEVGAGLSVRWNATGTGPFFGCMGVAPPPEAGGLTSVAPGDRFGGNLDLKLLAASESPTLYLPVNVPGALFSAGDGHAVQGDGEVCVTAAETGLDGAFRLTVIKGGGEMGPLRQPRAETATHHVAIGLARTLDEAQRKATRDMLGWMRNALAPNVAPADAYRLLSLVGELHVTQVVNGVVGVHLTVPKAALPPRGGTGAGAAGRTEL